MAANTSILVSACSFGDPNVPSTALLSPKQTPTPLVLASPDFATPETNSGSFESSSGCWTPRFAEEYSVFNATPGNLSAAQGPFVDFSICTPFQQATCGHKRQLSAGSIATEIASHVHHLSPNPNLPLPPVDPSRRLPSSPGPLAPGFGHDVTRDTARGSQEPSAKRVRLGGPVPKPTQTQTQKQTQTQTRTQTQTATPPPSRRKGERRLAPKAPTDTMHNDQSYRPEFLAGTPQQPNHAASFVTSPTDMFGFPLSVPATAAIFADSQVFWEPDPSMSSMDLDFAASEAMFQSLNQHAVTAMGSLDWPRSNDMFQQESGVAPPSNQATKPPPKRERVLAPKPPAQSQENNNPDLRMLGSSYTTSAGAPFGMSSLNGGVDPGLLFSRPPSSRMESATLHPLGPAESMPPLLQPSPLQSPARLPRDFRRSASTKETMPSRRLDVAASSSVKSASRPGLSRSFSENRGRKKLSRASALPPLAPAAQPGAQPNGRPVPQGSRSSGRSSPSKRHHRMSSLSSIPEDHGPKTRTSVKFTIDSRGRARAETTTVLVDDSEETTPRAIRYSTDVGYGERNAGSSGDDESSSDDEPIVIPSRNTSFALPDPLRPTSSHLFPPGQRTRAASTSSLGIYNNGAAQGALDDEDDAGSEAETLMNEPRSKYGDAASELRKVVEDRQKRPAVKPNPRVVTNKSRPPSASSSVSRLSVGEASLPTPASSQQDHMVRCICKQTESPPGSNDFMVEW